MGVQTNADGSLYYSGIWENDKIIGAAQVPPVMGQNQQGTCDQGSDHKLWNDCVGTLTWQNGDRYVGDFKNGQKSGLGTSTLYDGRKYVGEFKNDKYNGQGTYSWPNGDKYVGEIKDNFPTGQGAQTLANGEKYVGYFKDGKYNGFGVYTWPNSPRVQSGTWENGKFVR